MTTRKRIGTINEMFDPEGHYPMALVRAGIDAMLLAFEASAERQGRVIEVETLDIKVVKSLVNFDNPDATPWGLAINVEAWSNEKE